MKRKSRREKTVKELVLKDNELLGIISKNALITAKNLSFEKVTDKIEKTYKNLRDFNNG